MNEHDKSMIDSLSTTHPELMRLRTKHEEYEEQLRAISSKRWRSKGETLQEQKLKRLKLQGRDRMASILAKHRASQAS
ncbi:MAG: DUF465 domain-containing protein [Proteobacteria bacterium]|nr:DUF465 domain-containing protein [Pseudomonadota bacterium]